MRCLSRMVILLLISLFALQAVFAASKGSGYISGNILGLSGIPLQNAIIKIFREAKEEEALSVVRSNIHGFFKSIDLTPGNYFLQVSHQGYRPVTTTKFAINQGRTISLDITLHEFFESLSKDDDSRNWGAKTILRSVSDRRLISRYFPVSIDFDGSSNIDPFYRSGAMSIASSTPLDGESYLLGPHSSQNGVSSNFAITEPLSQHARMILSGQLDLGSGSFWRMRNTYNFRPDRDHDYRISAGYGLMNYIYPGAGAGSAEFFPQRVNFRESGVETMAFGTEASTRLLDLMAVKYGFEYSRLRYGCDLSFFHPSIQIVITPSDKWTFKTSVTSRHESDANTVTFPDGEILDLSEPALITMVGNRVKMSQVRHSEFSVRRNIRSDGEIEMAVYQDRMQGSGFPLLLTTNTQSLLTPAIPWKRQSAIIETGSKYPVQHGMRVAFRHAITDYLRGSVAYIYGGAVSIPRVDGSLTVAQMEEKLTNYMRKRNQHSIISQLSTTIPVTKTAVLASARWNSGFPLTPLDWFSDRMDIGSQSTNFEIRQPVQMPDFIGKAGQWEILVDIRNMLNQGKEVLQASNGEIILNRNPRSLRICFNLNFR
jgi:hypothetical protein